MKIKSKRINWILISVTVILVLQTYMFLMLKNIHDTMGSFQYIANEMKISHETYSAVIIETNKRYGDIQIMFNKIEGRIIDLEKIGEFELKKSLQD